MKNLNRYFVLVLAMLIASCSGQPNFDKLMNSALSGGGAGKVEISNPFTGAIFPKDIAAPSIRWKATAGEYKWLVKISVKGGGFEKIFDSEAAYFKVPEADWKELADKFSEKDIVITVLGYAKDKAISGDAKISISKDVVGAPIFYRTVPLPFSYAVEHLELISWRLGYVSDLKIQEPVLSNLPVCGNCHSFSLDGKTFGMDVDYGNDKGSYAFTDISENTAINQEHIITWSDFRREDGEKTFGLLSSISPDGRYALSTVKDRSIFVKQDNLEYSQLFFPIKGLVCVYDRKSKQFYTLNGANNPKYVQSNAIWAPDSKTIVFARADYMEMKEVEKSGSAILPIEYAADFISGKAGFKYDLYQVAFNDGKGGESKPLQGASNNGMSNYFPKYSPDGKWIVFNQAANFMLLMPDSKLWIMPAQGGEARKMKCNLGNMNSWHSWSPNGKWIVFTSKANGPYTQLYLTHIDENGNDSPPVLLENFSADKLACNIPEFVNLNGMKHFKLNENFLSSDYYILSKGKSKLTQGDFKGAIVDLTRAVQVNPKDVDSYNMRGIAYSELGNYKDAIADFSKIVELKGPTFEGLYNIGSAKFKSGDFKGAIDHLEKALRLNEKGVKALAKLSEAKYNLEDYRGAIEACDKIIKLDSKQSEAIYIRGLSKIQIGEEKPGIEDLRQASSLGNVNASKALTNIHN